MRRSVPKLSWKVIGLICLCAAYPGCDDYPHRLTSEEQVQALVFDDFIRNELDYTRFDGDVGMPLFVAYGPTDATESVQNYLARFYPVRPLSAAYRPGAAEFYVDGVQNRAGIAAVLTPFTLPAADFLVVSIETHYDSGSATFDYRLQREGKRWVIVDHDRTTIACRKPIQW